MLHTVSLDFRRGDTVTWKAVVFHLFTVNVAKEVARYAPNTILIIVSNPLDVMSYVAL